MKQKDGEWAENLMIKAVAEVENVVIDIVSDVGEMVIYPEVTMNETHKWLGFLSEIH